MGNSSSTPLQFHFLWLRDNCQCSSCIHPDSKQKLHSSGDIKSNIVPLSWKELPEGIEIVWANDEQNNSSQSLTTPFHSSYFTFEWLRNHAYDPIQSSFRRQRIWGVKEWDKVDLTKSGATDPISYSKLLKDKENHYLCNNEFKKAVRQLREYGLLFLESVPTEHSAVEKVAGLFGYIRETFYGKSWDVKSIAGAKNIAYTNLFLGLHMDLL